jgi:hypothetical protein
MSCRRCPLNPIKSLLLAAGLSTPDDIPHTARAQDAICRRGTAPMQKVVSGHGWFVCCIIIHISITMHPECNFTPCSVLPYKKGSGTAALSSKETIDARISTSLKCKGACGILLRESACPPLEHLNLLQNRLE